ncbi:MAG: ATP-dependent helicase [Candidatus Saccharibacteria bacterium]|nr:MAG: ATP-dependent helicase [Candidatus Saccharibacteria bacterium]
MDFTTRYNKLNPAQKQAVDHIDGPVMVIAGPGTGKTELLSMRAANILKKTDVLPSNILCLTFTESGATAMRQRLTKIIGADAYKVAIHTFHSFGTEIINQNGEFFYHGANFRAADELSSHEILRAIFDELEYSNPLASKMNGEYTHIGDTLTVISELKRSGLTSDELLAVLDANDHVIDTVEPLLAQVFAGRLSKSTVPLLIPIVDQARTCGDEITLPGISLLSRILADALEEAIAASEATNSTKPITAWRNTWMKKDEQGNFVLKSRSRSQKLRAVSYIYYQYLSRMQEAELYDFDDMILRVVHAMEVFPELRFNLQEKFQYIMVDEFQDTNMAQMRILFDLTSNEANNGRPNILVVGDDDQAIYSFQGANVGNISTFRDTFGETELITLTDNYRSSGVILEHARSVITLGQDRLENHIPELNKQLTPHRMEQGSVELVELPAINDERAWLASSIEAALKDGESAGSIAVLARRHHEIIALLPYFAEKGIRVNYERRDNLLDMDIIMLIEHVAGTLVALYEQRHADANSMLPQMLAHPAFKLDPQEIWRLSLRSQQNHQTWMEIMAVTPDLLPLHAWLVASSQMLAHTPLEQMLDVIIGSPRLTAKEPETATFISPLYEYFFNTDTIAEEPDAYLSYLEALRTIRTKLREYRPKDVPTIQSFLEFIRMHRRLGSTITSVRPRSTHATDAVTLMTAHKSKGLEFDTVYIVGAVDNAWGERVRTRSRLIGYPENLPLAPSGDTFDERLRLFFVAMTRARARLVISYSLTDSSNKSTLRGSFLTGDLWIASEPHLHSSIETLVHDAEIAWYQPLVSPIKPTMRELLAPVLENYKLSSTHLNNFLDVSRGGPEAFLMNNLLRFPQAISPSAAYGSAIHATLQQAHSHLTATGKHRPIEDILHDFEENLKAQRLDDKDFQTYSQKGSDTLSVFLDAKLKEFAPTQKTELSFANQGVFLGEAHLTGSLDLVDFNGDSIIVTDYKTGKPLRSWTGKTDYEKIKLHKYKQQLMFYNLLIKHSRDFNKYTHEKGILQFVEPTQSGEIIALEAQFSSDDLDQFALLIQKIWQHIITLDLPDTSHYEPSYKGMLQFEADLLES